MAKPVVHVERIGERGQSVAIYLDGIRVTGLRSYRLAETAGEPSVLTLDIIPSQIIWGAPEASDG